VQEGLPGVKTGSVGAKSSLTIWWQRLIVSGGIQEEGGKIM
jgi:hypothetical protein